VNRSNFKKLFFVVILFLLLFNFSFGQRFRAGIIGGFIGSQVAGDQLAGFNKSGFEFGGLVSTSLSQKFDLSFEMVYIQKGSKKPINAEQGDFEYYKMSLNYIEVPLLLQYNFSKKLKLETGTGIGVLLSFNEEDENGNLTGIYEREPFKKIEWSIMGSLNYMLLDNFYFSLGLGNSILPIRNYSPEPHIFRDQFNSVLMFSFKYVFNKNSTDQQ
jgi:Outer membrane protein beta-barrel domain